MSSNNKLIFQISFVIVLIGALNWGLYAMDQNGNDLIKSILPGVENEQNRKYIYYVVAAAAIVAGYMWLNYSGDICSGQANAQQKQ